MPRPHTTEHYELSDAEKRDLIKLIEQGKPLPEQYRFLLFADKREVELVWNGKSREVCTAILPFQTLEHIDEPRKETGSAGILPAGSGFQPELLDTSGRQVKGWTNKLIWGDNKLILASLKAGALRRQIEDAGGLKLIYIDPPFDVGADFSMDIEIGGETFHKEPNLLEQIAYRDTWGRGADSFIAMIYERLILMRDLMHSDGSIYVHMGWGVSHYVRGVMDEVFGKERCLNQIVWKRQTAHSDTGQGSEHLGRLHDVILLYSKNEHFPWNMQFTAYDESYLQSHYGRVEEKTGRRYRLDNLTAPGGAGKGNPTYEFLGITRFWRYSRERMEELHKVGRVVQTNPGTVPQYKRYLNEMPGVPIQDLWTDLSSVNSQAIEAVGYATQKPETLLERVLKLSSNEGDLVADFFCGSGTTAAVAEKLGRKWIATDLGKFGIHTTRKRLIQVQRELKSAGRPFRAFEVLNLGRYERQAYLNVAGRLTGNAKAQALARKEQEFRDLILKAYRAEPLGGGSFASGSAGFQPAPSGILPDGSGNAPHGKQRKASVPGSSEDVAGRMPATAGRMPALPSDEFFHGKTGGRLAVVGPINLPVGRLFVEEVITECRKRGASRVDVLAFEFEMGLFPAVLDEAKQKGIDLAPKTIPPEVFDPAPAGRRGEGPGPLRRHRHVETTPRFDGKDKLTLAVELTDFSVYYSQGVVDAITAELKAGKSEVVCEQGKLVKFSKDKDGVITREVLTKKWTDWVDYWAVDFEYESRREIIKVAKTMGVEGELAVNAGIELLEFEERWTGACIFENEWQSFRTRRNRDLELKSAVHTYARPDRYTVAVKVIDIFGNDTMTLVPVTAG